MIPWHTFGYAVPHRSTNGEEALMYCQQELPDLIVTDIGMPGMNGIELIKSIKKISQHQPQFVILSCHDDFNYAKQAVQIGVQDYILKESLDIPDITDLLSKLKQKMDQEQQHQAEIQKLNFQVHQNKSLIKEKWIHDVLSAPVSKGYQWKEQLAEFGLSRCLSFFIPAVACIHRTSDAFHRYEDEHTLKFIIENAMEELLQDIPDLLFLSYISNQFFLLYNCENTLKINPCEYVVNLCKEIQYKLMKLLKLPVSILVGDLERDYAGIKQQFHRLQQDTDKMFYYPEPQILKMTELTGYHFHKEDLLNHYDELSEQLHRVILEGNADVEKALNPFIQFITGQKFPPNKVKQFVNKLVLDIMLKLKINQQYANEKIQQQLVQISNIGELQRWLVHFVKEAVRMMEDISKQSKKIEIINAQKYVLLQLDRKITLDEVANHLHLNPSYFSRLYKKETNENFIEYVTRMKMERAKELLNTSEKTIDSISHQLGYDNRSYFVKLFKQHFGVLPSKFVKS
nr:helix-turn-helix domain-containing protein [Paenibacillus mangrovi]